MEKIAENFGNGLYSVQKKRIHRLQNDNKNHVQAQSSLPPVAGINSTLNTPSTLPPLAQTSAVSPDEEAKINQLSLSPAELRFHLRLLQQPISLFAEDHSMRLARFKGLLKSGALTMTKAELIQAGQYFPLNLADMKKSERKLERAEVDAGGDCTIAGRRCVGNINEGIPGLDDDEEHVWMKQNFDSLCDEYKIMVFFRQLLKEWESELEKRPDPEKLSRTGISNVATYRQCACNLIPLLQMCREKRLPADLMEALLIIVTHCLQRDYLSAIDRYIKLVIATAPPIEDSMVAIQKSLGKEETPMKSMAQTRKDKETKYLQSVKRLMTLCQRRYPWAPSKHVEFNSRAYANGTQSLFTEQTRNHQVRIDGKFPSGMK